MSFNLREELQHPTTPLGKQYLSLVLLTIVVSVLFLFFSLELPQAFHHSQTWVMWFELFFLVVFSIDFLLRVATQPLTDAKNFILLVFDLLAIVPSALVVMAYWGLMPEQHLEILGLLRLFRLLRVLQLLRMSSLLTEILGISVFSLVFGNMAAHLGLRVLVSSVDKTLQLNIYQYIERPILLLAVTAVGSVMGIALAITFGVVNRKRDLVTEMHRTTMDAVDNFERDFKDVFENVTPEQRTAPQRHGHLRRRPSELCRHERQRLAIPQPSPRRGQNATQHGCAVSRGAGAAGVGSADHHANHLSCGFLWLVGFTGQPVFCVGHDGHAGHHGFVCAAAGDLCLPRLVDDHQRHGLPLGLGWHHVQCQDPQLI
jgi:hypothetical protein